MKHQFASIHGGLLARKGEASPAIPSPLSHVTYIDEAPQPTVANDARRDIELSAPAALMKTKPAVSPEVSPEIRSEAAPETQPEIQPSISAAPPVAQVEPRVEAPVQVPVRAPVHADYAADEARSDSASASAGGCCGGFAQGSAETVVSSRPIASPNDQKRTEKASMRLTGEQKRRLKTVAVQMNRPQQDILSEALDAYLDEICGREMKNCACLRSKLS